MARKVESNLGNFHLSPYLPHTNLPSLASHYLHRKNLKPTTCISLPIHIGHDLHRPCWTFPMAIISYVGLLARSPTCIRCGNLRTTGLARKRNFAQWAMAGYYKMPNTDISARYVVRTSQSVLNSSWTYTHLQDNHIPQLSPWRNRYRAWLLCCHNTPFPLRNIFLTQRGYEFEYLIIKESKMSNFIYIPIGILLYSAIAQCAEISFPSKTCCSKHAASGAR